MFAAGFGNEKPALDTIQDRIAAYMIGKVEEHELSDQDRAIKDRWINIWSLLRNHHSPSQAVEVHLEHFKEAGTPISRRTAFHDLRNATDLWGSHTQISRQAQLVLLQDYATQVLRKSFKKHDLKEANKAVANLVKITALQEPYVEGEEEAHTYVLQLRLGNGEEKAISLDKLNQIPESDYYQVVEAVEGEEIDSLAMRSILEERADD